ncbi:hypothetical protein N9O71_01815 [bacterium]|nr:hypothetical protein [bacterium]
MSAIFKFLKLLLLGTLALVLAGAVIGVGYWQYTRQAELLDGFEYIAWNSDYQRQIDTLKDGEGKEFKVMKLARRYNDHWLVGHANPDGYISTRGGGDLTNKFSVSIYWDVECVEGSEIDTGEEYSTGEAMLLECVDGGKLRFGVAYRSDEASSPWRSIPYEDLDFDGFKADLTGMKYWPWEEAKKFATLQKAKKASESD